SSAISSSSSISSIRHILFSTSFEPGIIVYSKQTYLSLCFLKCGPLMESSQLYLCERLFMMTEEVY
ncbi:MAG: hypothetical protein PHH39_10500, partial [Methanothrix soehngenii]|nr:hypothetical protein [Methanothrix soehngenii]